MAKYRAFGVGCFHFGYKKPLPYTFKTTDYVHDVERALSALPSVDNVNVTHDEQFAFSDEVVEDPPSIEEVNFFPRTHFFEVDFTVVIPSRVIRELFPHENMDARVGSERFRVLVRDAFHGPITFVECLDPGEYCDPSSAVRLLREFLVQEFAKLQGPVSFQYLGPAPFHADFFIRQGNSTEDTLTFTEKAQRGYNIIEFLCGANLTLEEAAEQVFSELRSELDVFYDRQRHYCRLLDEGSQLVNEWNDAQALTERKTSIWNLTERIKIHRAARDLAMHGYTLQARFDVDAKEMQRNLVSLYSKEVPRYLERYLNEKQIPDYPIDAIIKWAERVEDGSFKQAEIQSVVVSALAGGIVGSIVTKFI